MTRWQQPQVEVEEPFERIDVERAKQLIQSGEVEVIDVRETDEYQSGHIPGARHVPLGELINNPQKYLTRDNILFVCAVGERSAVACEVAAAIGLQRLYNLQGGTIEWIARGNPVEK